MNFGIYVDEHKFNIILRYLYRIYEHTVNMIVFEISIISGRMKDGIYSR